MAGASLPRALFSDRANALRYARRGGNPAGARRAFVSNAPKVAGTACLVSSFLTERRLAQLRGKTSCCMSSPAQRKRAERNHHDQRDYADQKEH